jgi:hypothetical protein
LNSAITRPPRSAAKKLFTVKPSRK